MIDHFEPPVKCWNCGFNGMSNRRTIAKGAISLRQCGCGARAAFGNSSKRGWPEAQRWCAAQKVAE